jgi:hypothetical protein
MVGEGRIITMARRRHTPEQIIRMLREPTECWARARRSPGCYAPRGLVDEYTLQALAMRVRRSYNADEVVTVIVIERLVAERGPPRAEGTTIFEFSDLVLEETGVREGRRFRNASKLSGLPHHKILDEFDFAFSPSSTPARPRT